MTQEQFFSELLATMFNTRKNKRYGKDSMEFEYNWAPLLVRMFDELQDRTFRIRNNYAFLTSIPKWREIFATIFQGRMADHLLCDTLRPYIEQELHPRTFNNRKGMGMHAAINQVMEDIMTVSGGTAEGLRHTRIIKFDFKGFFPNAWCDYMCQCFHNIIDKYADDIAERYDDTEMPAFLKWLATVCIHCYPTQHCILRTPSRLWREHIEPEKSLFTKQPGVGVPIGRMTSQEGMGLYVNDEVKWLSDEMGVLVTLFMDDGVIVVPEERCQYALSLLPLLRQRLAAKGVRLNEKKFYCQPGNHGLEFLGYHIHNNRIIVNDTTFDRCVNAVHEYNCMPVAEKYDNIDKFLSSINSYTGILKNTTSYDRLKLLCNEIDADWWQWLEWNECRKCIVANTENTYRLRMKRKYHLSISNI